MEANNFIKYTPIDTENHTALERAVEYRAFIEQRRSLRFFSDKSVSKETIENIIMKTEAILTCFSGTALEAFELGTKVFIFGSEGEIAYKNYIDEGLFTFIDNKKVIIDKLKESE